MINCIGQMFGSSGYSNHFRGVVNELNKITECKIITNLPVGFERVVNDQELEMIKREQDYDINLIITHPLNWKSNLSAKRNFVYLVWEGDKVPQWILEECINPKIEKIICPSEHTKKAVANTTYSEEHNKIINKLVVIPHGHNPEVFYSQQCKKGEGVPLHNSLEPRSKAGEDKQTVMPVDADNHAADTFKFLANKGLRNLEDRGGIPFLIRAYLEEFTEEDNVELILKINPAYGVPNLLLMFPELKNPDNPKVRYIHNDYTPKQLNELYNECDVFVSPTRAEAFNLPCLEAMACGKPVITTNYGGQTDFCTDENSWLIEYELVNAPEIEYEEVNWGVPSHEHLRSLLRYSFEHKDEVLLKGEAGLNISKKYTWASTAKQIFGIINR